MRRLAVFVLSLAMLMVATAPATSQEADSSDLLRGIGLPELRVTSDGMTVDVDQTEVDAGRYLISFENSSGSLGYLELFRPPEGSTQEDVLTALTATTTGEGSFEVLYRAGIAGGVASVPPGATGSVVTELDQGDWLFIVTTEGEDTMTATEAHTSVSVQGEMPELDEPEAVTASLYEYGFTFDGPLASGPQILKLTTVGAQPHHLIMFEVPEGTTEDDVVSVLMSEMGGPESDAAASPDPGATPVAAADPEPFPYRDVFGSSVLSMGRSNWVQLDLASGTYAAACFIPDIGDGTPHVMLGQIEILTVQ
jgi:hypothetical protein